MSQLSCLYLRLPCFSSLLVQGCGEQTQTVLAGLAGRAANVPRLAAELARSGLLAELLDGVASGSLELHKVGGWVECVGWVGWWSAWGGWAPATCCRIGHSMPARLPTLSATVQLSCACCPQTVPLALCSQCCL